MDAAEPTLEELKDIRGRAEYVGESSAATRWERELSAAVLCLLPFVESLAASREACRVHGGPLTDVDLAGIRERAARYVHDSSHRGSLSYDVRRLLAEREAKENRLAAAEAVCEAARLVADHGATATRLQGIVSALDAYDAAKGGPTP